MVTCSKINDRSVGLFGNKLFIVASLIGLAKRNNDSVLLPRTVGGDWEYGHIFEHGVGASPEPLIINYIYQEPFFHYQEIPYKPNLDIYGFFQSEKYFIDAEELVRYYFEPKQSIIETLKKRYPVIWNEECVSIHVRRNDYLHYPDIHYPCSLQYYTDAIESLPKADKYIIFSDDIQWCKQTFVSEDNDIIFIENQTNYEDMFLMSYCKHHVTANSSFSWWGSWLNKSTSKKIVMPEKWFGERGPQDYQDIYPSKGVIKL